MAYEEKFRQRAVEFKDDGHTFAEVEKVFGIDSNRYYAWKKIFAAAGKYVLSTKKHDRKRKIDKEELSKIVDKNPDILEKELAEIFKCSQPAVSKRLKKLNKTNKKRLSPTPKNHVQKDGFS